MEFASPDERKKWLNSFDLVCCASGDYVGDRIQNYRETIRLCEITLKGFLRMVPLRLPKTSRDGPAKTEIKTFAVAAQRLGRHIKKFSNAIDDLDSAAALLPGAYRTIQAHLQNVEHFNDLLRKALWQFEESASGGRHSVTFPPFPPDVEAPGKENPTQVRFEMLFGRPWRQNCRKISRINTARDQFPVDPVAWEILPIQIDILSVIRLEVRFQRIPQKVSDDDSLKQSREGIEIQQKLELAVNEFAKFLRFVQIGEYGVT